MSAPFYTSPSSLSPPAIFDPFPPQKSADVLYGQPQTQRAVFCESCFANNASSGIEKWAFNAKENKEYVIFGMIRLFTLDFGYLVTFADI